MIDGIVARQDATSIAKLKKKPVEHETVPHDQVPEAVSAGWEVEKTNVRTTRLKRPKEADPGFEDRVWTLFYNMEFTHLSDAGGAFLRPDPRDRGGSMQRIPIVAVDEEVALAVMCSTTEEGVASSQPRRDIRDLERLKGGFSRATARALPAEHKRVPVLVAFVRGREVTDADVKYAGRRGVALIDENDLEYYEELVRHVGPAAKYQLLSDAIPGQSVPALRCSVPAVRVKLGKRLAYSFSVRPDYLLKIAYVSHRARRQSGGVGTYQRMVTKRRLNDIRKYISADGMFPTSIVVSLDYDSEPRFDVSHPDENGALGAKVRYGTLHLHPAYKSAWVIDGQHRLYAYSGHERSATDSLFVIAFYGLDASAQARLFIDINHKQKSVKSNLLHDLYADLHWQAEDEEKRVWAVVSRAVRELNGRASSPLHQRVLFEGSKGSATRCVSLRSIFESLNQPGVFLARGGTKRGLLWAPDSEAMLARTTLVTEAWLTMVRDRTADWWDLGKAEGGGLTMNDGITVCLGVLRSVFQHLESRESVDSSLTTERLVQKMRPFGEALGEYLGNLTQTERQAFRQGARGGQGQINTRRRCEDALRGRLGDFEPPGLLEWLSQEDSRRRDEAYAVIHRLELRIRRLVIEGLKSKFGSTGNRWWKEGVPLGIREEASKREEQSDEPDCGREAFLNLIDFQRIIKRTGNWEILQGDLSFGGQRGKDKGTKWLAKLNDIRKVVMHPAEGRTLSSEQLGFLRELEEWLLGRQVLRQ